MDCFEDVEDRTHQDRTILSHIKHLDVLNDYYDAFDLT